MYNSRNVKNSGVNSQTKIEFHLLDKSYYGKFLSFQGAYPVSPSIRKFHMQR